MFNQKHYVPVLKGKRAEFPALGDLHSKDHVTPLMEAVPDQIHDFIPRKMPAPWATGAYYFIDMIFLDDEDSSESEWEVHPIRTCFTEVAARQQHAIPVTGTDRSPAYQMAVKWINDSQHQGVAVRLTPADFEGDDEPTTVLSALLSFFSISPEETDIIIDLGSMAGTAGGTVAAIHRANLFSLPMLAQWRTVTVVSGAFPVGLSPLVSGWNFLARTDWLGWKSVVANPQGLTRLPSYGDFAIGSPDLPHGGRGTILAQLRYTLTDQFMVWKGANVFKHPDRYKQFFAICADLVSRPQYHGQSISAGDQEISEKAANVGSSGNAERWRRIGVNQHVEMVIQQIASLP